MPRIASFSYTIRWRKTTVVWYGLVEGKQVDQQTTTLGDLASLVRCEYLGPADLSISGAAPLYEVQANQVTLLEDVRLVDSLCGKVAAVVVSKPIEDCSLPQIISANPRESFGEMVRFFLFGSEHRTSSHSTSRPYSTLGDGLSDPAQCEIAPTASIDPTAKIAAGAVIEHGVTVGKGVVIGSRVHLMPNVVVMEGSVVGDDTVIFPNVTLYPRTQVGKRVTIHAGAVLGAYGFGYKSSQAGHVRTPQLGYVVIEDEVEIGACVTIDRGTYGSTRVGFGTKIDNQVMIGHNCQIGKHNLLCSQVGIAGSCKTGDFVVLAGQVGLKDHITLGDHAIVGAQAGVMDDLAGGQVYLGSPATPQREQMQIMAVQRRLPELRRTVKELEKHLPPRSDNRAA